MLTPRQFLQNYRLPQAAIQKSEEKLSKILLFKCYTYLKFHGHVLDRDGDERIRSVGPPIVIPETFPGWMAMITRDGQTAGYFLNIRQIAEAGVTHFLVRDTINGYQRFPCRKRGQKYKKIVINGGEVLRYIRTYESYRGRLYKREPKRYAKCARKDGKLVLLPHETLGRFYMVANKYEFTHNHLFRLSDLLRQEQLQLPLVTLLMTGYPKDMKDFSKIIRLETIQPQTVILASKFRDKEPILFETNLDSNVTLQATRFDSSTQNLLKYCQEFADNWRNSIKYHKDERCRKGSFTRKRFVNLFRYERRYLSFRKKIKSSGSTGRSRISAYHVYDSIDGVSNSSVLTLDVPFAKNTTVIQLNSMRDNDNPYESVC
ncbi:uncharacterized protein [Centruroides vittatus]|uniref:uncharacterized protein isoform X1 n=1 Tax=Centruroides vittatus TaxID=120091 RepID=UPI00351038E9